MTVKCADDTLVRIHSVEEAELIVADMERIIREIKKTIDLIKAVTPKESRMKTPASNLNAR